MPRNKKTGKFYQRTGKRFPAGSPQVTFIRRNGKKFRKTFRDRSSSAKAIRAYRSKGGRVYSTGVLGQHKSANYSYTENRNLRVSGNGWKRSFNAGGSRYND